MEHNFKLGIDGKFIINEHDELIADLMPKHENDTAVWEYSKVFAHEIALEIIKRWNNWDELKQQNESLRKDIEGLQAVNKEAERNAYNASVDNSKLIGKITELQEENNRLRGLLKEIEQSDYQSK